MSMQMGWRRIVAGVTGAIMLTGGMAASAVTATTRGDPEPSVAAFPGHGTGPERPAAQAPAVKGPWKHLTDYPTRTVDNRVVLLGATWYSVGGSDGWESRPDVRAFDPVTMSWRSVADLPAPRHAASVGAVDGLIVVTGGWTSDEATAVETYIYDSRSDTWNRGSDNPFAAVSSAGTAVLDGRLYSVGGCTTGACLPVTSVVTAYDRSTDSWTRLADYPLSVAFPACGALDGRIYCSGGVTDMDETSQDSTALTYVYDPTDDTWSPVAAAPAPTWAAAYAVADGMLVTIGGVVDEVPSTETWGYRPADDVWVSLPDTNYPVHRGAAACGLVRVGGVYFEPTSIAEVLPGFGDCEEGYVGVLVERVAGTDRYGTAAAVSARFEPGVETVFVVTGKNYPDALAAAARAGSVGAPVLLTRQGSLPSASSMELGRLDPQEVVVVGGTEAVQDRVIEVIEVVTDAPVRRVTGSNRYVTAANVAAEFESADVVFVATGLDYPDALAGASRAGAVDAPVLLVRTDSVPSATRRELARLAPEQLVLLGGTTAVTTGVQEALSEYGTVTRVAGTDRYRTAAAVAEAYPSADTTYVASGQDWPDALAGAALAGHEEVPMILVRQDSVPGATWTSLERLGPRWVSAVGGPFAVSESVLTQLRTLE